MRWSGKFWGAILGLMFGGTIGLILGIFFGHLVDMGFLGDFLRRHAYQQFNPDRGPNDTFFQSIFPLMGYLAKSDGRVTEEEIATAKRIMGSMNLSSALHSRAIALFNQGKEPYFSPDPLIKNLRQRYGRQPVVLRMCYDVLQQIARADGVPAHPKKTATLNQLARGLGVVAFDFNGFDFNQFNEQFRQQYGHSGQQRVRRPTTFSQKDPYTVLGVSRSADMKEIKTCYRRLMSQNHPDKLASKGLSEAELAKATEKTQEIKSAYEEIKRQRGFA